jgi:hypothetical protein|tara:strand:- start:121 stop:270 length:150 start_codon:yes stop_codon:yes gene_type:complete
MVGLLVVEGVRVIMTPMLDMEMVVQVLKVEVDREEMARAAKLLSVEKMV